MFNKIFLVALLNAPVSALAQSSLTTFGTPGLIDMPSAESAPDAELSSTVSYFGGTTRTTLTFQITPRLSASFRYTGIRKWVAATGEGTFDRSFDLRYRLVDEGKYRPAVAVGLQDFIGTGIYSGEYLVASKTLARTVTVTGGIGWGRFGSLNGFGNPLGGLSSSLNTRPAIRQGAFGGVVESAKWFRGDAAFFGGVAWQATPKLTLKAEYSSDAYVQETTRGNFKHKSPYNFGLDYKLSKGVNLQAYYMYGSEFGAGVTFKLNPRDPVIYGGAEKAPQPVRVREPSNIANLGWTELPNAQQNLRKATSELLEKDGILLEAMVVGPKTATLRIRNQRYTASAEVIGRTARILSRAMPDSVETFKIIPVVRGIAISEVTLKRSDLEVLEHDPDGSRASFAKAKIADSARSGTQSDLVYQAGLYPRFRWGFGPYLSASYFDPDSPIRAEIGAQLSASYDIAPGLVISGAVRKRATGNKHTATRVSDSKIRRVRSDARIYDKEGDPSLNHLTLAYYFRPGKNLYGRVTVGYLEKMYGGVSAEVLWKPVESRVGLGAEVNVLKQRDFNQLFGFQAYQVTTGHLTAYWDMGNGFHSEASVGRYLGGDVGGTLKLERTFRNGWRVGAYATLTDTSFSDFGEGSFDKGLVFTVPLDHLIGSPTNKTYNTVLQPLSRDGGARVSVDGRLYDTIRSYQKNELEGSWGRFWR